MSRAEVIPFPNSKATKAQIRKLLTMLSLQSLIDVEWEDGLPVHDLEQAIEWLDEEMGIIVRDLEDLNREQIQKCFEELQS